MPREPEWPLPYLLLPWLPPPAPTGGLRVFRAADDGLPLQQLLGEYLVRVDPALLLRDDREWVESRRGTQDPVEGLGGRRVGCIHALLRFASRTEETPHG